MTFLVLQGVSQERAEPFVNTALAEGQNREDVEASKLVLSNPFDLAVIAELLNRGLTPNLLTLAEQQYQEMANDFRVQVNYPFPLRRFSEHVYENVLKDASDLNSNDFRHEESMLCSGRGW